MATRQQTATPGQPTPTPPQPASAPGTRDCAGPSAFPTEEAELVWPSLRQVQPEQVAPGDTVEVLGTGGNLHWENECGEFWLESARDFQLFFDGEPAGSITCYANMCFAELTVPTGAQPGTHTISVEGGAGLEIEAIGQTPAKMGDLELVGYLGKGQARAVTVEGDHAYVGIDHQLAALDISEPSQPRRVDYVVLPAPAVKIALAGAFAYVASPSGLHVVDISEPSGLEVVATVPTESTTDGVVATGDRAYVSAGDLYILDLAEPGAPRLAGTYGVPLGPGEVTGRVMAVAGDYAYTVFDNSYDKTSGLRILDVSRPTAVTEVGALALRTPVHDLAVVNGHVYLLVGEGSPELVVVDVSDPANPWSVGPVPEGPGDAGPARPPNGSGPRLAVGDRYLLAVHGGDEGGLLRVFDVTDPANPVALGSYEGVAPEVADMTVKGEHVYLASDDGLSIVSIGDPSSPSGTGVYRGDTLAGRGRDLAVAGTSVYAAAGEAGLQVIDVSDPVNPSVVGSLDTGGHAWAIALAGRYAYVADEYEGLRIIDVADPRRPVEVGAYDVPGLHEFFHGISVVAGGDLGHVYAYVADGGLLDTGLRIVDVSDPANPVEVSTLPLILATAKEVPPPRVEDVAVADGFAYLAAGTAGLRVIDVSDPGAPNEVGSYETPGRSASLTISGHYVYLVDGDLRIVDVSDPKAPAEVGFYDLPAGPSEPRVAVQGRYATLAVEGLRVLDVSDPGALVEVAMNPLPSGNVAVADEMIYVVGDGLFILHSTLPTN